MSNPRLPFIVEARDPSSKARACSLVTLHGEIQTPIFMPVATQAAMRAQDTATMRAIGSQVLLANTYHLLLRPGPEVFEKFGGIHRFMDWQGAVLTDSGGFQIFSLSKFLKMTEEGASFRSYVDGKTIHLSPEQSIGMQRAIGSDIMMVLDQCIPSTSTREEALAALHLTHRWAKRSLAARGDSQQALFGIVQGALYKDLRRESAAQITSLPLDGFAIGGLAVGEGRAEREDTTDFTTDLLPQDRPRYLMGVGTPIDLLEAVYRGVDMFDCILPTSLGMQGVAYTSKGKIDLRRGVHKFSEDPIDPNCSCATCRRFSRAYLHHLAKVGEYVGGQYVGFHNLTFYQSLMTRMRGSILKGTFSSLYKELREVLARADDDNPPNPPKRKPKHPPEELGDYEIVIHEPGYGKIRQKSSGEIMHSVSRPLDESRILYVGQSRLQERVRESVDDPLIIWDVGLGAGTNAMASIFAVEELFVKGEARRPVRIISFERDLDSLRLALHHPNLFEHVRHQAPQALLREGVWKSPKGALEWELVKGDFAEVYERAPAPDIIYFDPFSYKVDVPLWNVELFQKVYGKSETRQTVLLTYSASTMVRATLLAVGFYVGFGESSGPKSSTTVAFTPHALNRYADFKLLDDQWFLKWTRSDAAVPPELDGDRRKWFEAQIRNHPQFGLTPQSN